MHETGAGGSAHSHDGEQPLDDGRPRIAFVGAGHVGTALGVAFARAGWQVTAVASRDDGGRSRFAQLVPGARAFAEANAVLDDADLIFLTVPDDAVAEAAGNLPLYSGQALVHTSGALPASVLAPAMAAGTSMGSFHPLVAFADLERGLAALPGATIALEGDESLLPVLADLAESIGARPVSLPVGTKIAYHAAASMAAGGQIALLAAIARVGAESGFDEPTALSVYLPLVRQSLANAENLGTVAALTGPIVRGDAGTLARHLAFLADHAPGALPLYVELARYELELTRRRGALPDDRLDQLRGVLDAARPAVGGPD